MSVGVWRPSLYWSQLVRLYSGLGAAVRSMPGPAASRIARRACRSCASRRGHYGRQTGHGKCKRL